MDKQQVTHLMSNDELDTWADIYAQAKLSELLDIPFSTFLDAPFTYLACAGQDTALDSIISGHRPLLPAQVQVTRKIHQQWSDQDKAANNRGHLSLVVNQSF
jgi:hypothetical protein